MFGSTENDGVYGKVVENSVCVGADSDSDGVRDGCDNCPDHVNPEQDDCDDDAAGCASDCAADVDEDGVPDCGDTCLDYDGDGYGDGTALGNTCLGTDCKDDTFTCDLECLDLNGDDQVDYITVYEEAEGDTHVAILRVPLGENEYQDVASVDLEKVSGDEVAVQIVGDEELYGPNYIIEPAEKSASAWPIFEHTADRVAAFL